MHCLAQGLSVKFLHVRRWLRAGFHTQEHAFKGQACTALCPSASPQPAAFPSDLLRPLPNYRGTSGFPVSLIFQTLFLKKKKKEKKKTKKKHAHFFIECHSGRKTGLEPFDFNFQKIWSLVVFFLIKPPHNLKFLHVVIIQFQNTKLLLHRVPMERPPQQDNHRFCHESAARCPPSFSAWAATGFLSPCTLLSF